MVVIILYGGREGLGDGSSASPDPKYLNVTEVHHFAHKLPGSGFLP